MFGERQSGLIDPFLTGVRPGGQAHLLGRRRGGRNIGQLRFTTNTRDARWEFTAPADGEYIVQVRDLYFQQRGEPRFVYRLSIRRPQPDFRLVAVPTHDIQPDATIVGRGGRHWMDVLAFRNDGFDEPDPDRGDRPAARRDVRAGRHRPGQDVGPAGLSRGRRTRRSGMAQITITGKATIDGTDVTRVARGGGLTWPTVNTPGIARMADSIVLSVRETPPFALDGRARADRRSGPATSWRSP